MNWLDYREKLGIAYCDTDKQRYFLAKIFNFLDGISSGLTFGEYLDFCDKTGTPMNTSLTDSYHAVARYNHCCEVLREHRRNLADFFSYYVALMNAVRERTREPKQKFFLDLIKGMLTQAQIPFQIVEDDDGFFLFPKGAKELDDTLVSQPLQWLEAYPKTHTAFIKALKEYADATADNASDVADKLRKTLETFIKEFFNTTKSLENCKSIYGAYLREQGVPAEISGNLETLLQAYTNFMNGYAKHQDRTSVNILEYLLYQTGNIIRLLITLRKNEPTDQT